MCKKCEIQGREVANSKIAKYYQLTQKKISGSRRGLQEMPPSTAKAIEITPKRRPNQPPPAATKDDEAPEAFGQRSP
ncbi:hypothetical protein ACFYPT_37740 [Streptomyces sp. NPDC005529]|uniref:hypothetical protein n=1 Tax=unclassified Streptomyces TaxID=2593676 RepID=UPI00339DCDA6